MNNHVAALKELLARGANPHMRDRVYVPLTLHMGFALFFPYLSHSFRRKHICFLCFCTVFFPHVSHSFCGKHLCFRCFCTPSRTYSTPFPFAQGGDTPAHICCERDNLECLIELLKAGANMEDKNNVRAFTGFCDALRYDAGMV